MCDKQCKIDNYSKKVDEDTNFETLQAKKLRILKAKERERMLTGNAFVGLC